MKEHNANGVDDDAFRCKQQVCVEEQLKLMMRRLRVDHTASGTVDASVVVRLVVRD